MPAIASEFCAQLCQENVRRKISLSQRLACGREVKGTNVVRILGENWLATVCAACDSRVEGSATLCSMRVTQDIRKMAEEGKLPLLS